jgi:large subunit ribosomal protein L19e
VIHMTIATVRRLAADIIGVGENKIKISPDGLKEAEGALTRSDVRGLIEKGIIKKDRSQGRASTRRVGRVGHGHRRGTPMDSKSVWMQKIRSQRNVYKMLVKSGALKQKDKRAVYSKIKSGMLRSKRALLIYLKEADMIPKDTELPKTEFKPKMQKAKKAQPKTQSSTAKPAQNPQAKPAASQPAQNKTSVFPASEAMSRSSDLEHARERSAVRDSSGNKKGERK